MSVFDAVAGVRPGTASQEWSGRLGESRQSAIASLLGARVRDDGAVGRRQDGPPGARNSSYVRACSPGGQW